MLKVLLRGSVRLLRSWMSSSHNSDISVTEWLRKLPNIFYIFPVTNFINCWVTGQVLISGVKKCIPIFVRTNLSLSGPHFFRELGFSVKVIIRMKFQVKGCVLRSAEFVSFNLQDVTQSGSLLKNLKNTQTQTQHCKKSVF